MQQSAQAIFDELCRHGLVVDIVNRDRGLLSFHDGNRQRFIHSTKPDTSGSIGVMISDNKQLAQQIAASLGIRAPESVVDPDEKAARDFLHSNAPLVAKPLDGAHGNGVVLNITDDDQLATACRAARTASRGDRIILQQQVAGNDIRILVIGDQVGAAAVRRPAEIVGDGVSTVRQRIEYENTHNPDRAANYKKKLNYIDITAAVSFLGTKIDTYIPTKGEVYRVVGPSNIGKGGTSIDVTDEVPFEIQRQAIELARSIGLSVCGVDFMTDDIADSSAYYFIEANACPSLGLHLNPNAGSSRPVAKMLVDYMLRSE